MSGVVTLSLRAPLTVTVEVDGFAPDRFAAMSEKEIAHWPLAVNGRPARIGDLFDVRGERSSRVRVEGDLRLVDGLAAGTAGGEMIVEGNLGRRVAAGMSGGLVDVRGDVGDDAGLAMSGGSLRIIGSAGHRVGAGAPGASKGMTGGEIIVNGSAGDDAGAHLRRGLVVVAGEVGADTGRAMIAGTVVAFGAVGPRPARGSKRGSLVALGRIEVPPTYRYACTYQPPHVRFTLTYLRRRYGLAIEDDALSGRFHRYCGDAGEVGKGEILALVRAEERSS